MEVAKHKENQKFSVFFCEISKNGFSEKKTDISRKLSVEKLPRFQYNKERYLTYAPL